MFWNVSHKPLTFLLQAEGGLWKKLLFQILMKYTTLYVGDSQTDFGTWERLLGSKNLFFSTD